VTARRLLALVSTAAALELAALASTARAGNWIDGYYCGFDTYAEYVWVYPAGLFQCRYGLAYNGAAWWWDYGWRSV
jgi:hypothetical protein